MPFLAAYPSTTAYMSFQPHISTATFVKILQDDALVREDELRIFQKMHA